MRRLLCVATLSGLFACASAQASVFADDFGKCLVWSASAVDKADLARWILAAITLAPEMAPISVMKPSERAHVQQKAEGVTLRLITQDCRQQAVMALRVDGPAAFQQGFSLLGQASMQSVMDHPAVGGDLMRVAHRLGSTDAMKALMREVAPPPAPPGQAAAAAKNKAKG